MDKVSDQEFCCWILSKKYSNVYLTTTTYNVHITNLVFLKNYILRYMWKFQQYLPAD